MDTCDGLAIVQDAAPFSAPVLGDGMRALNKGIHETGGAIYQLGEMTEDITATASDFAEGLVHTIVESVIQSVEDSAGMLFDEVDGQPPQPHQDYFADIDASIIEHVVAVRADGVEKEEAEDNAAAGVQVQGKSRFLRRPNPIRWFRAGLKRVVGGGAVPSMHAQGLLSCLMILATRSITDNVLHNGLSFIIVHFYLKAVESVFSEQLGERMIQDIRLEATNQLQAGTPERTRSVNALLARFWEPLIEPRLNGFIMRRLNILMARCFGQNGSRLRRPFSQRLRRRPSSNKVENTLPAFQPTSNVTWLAVTKVRLGSKPFRFQFMLVKDYAQLLAHLPVERNPVMSDMIEHVENATNNALPERMVYMELGLDYPSCDSKLTFRLGLPRKHRRGWWRVGSYVPTYPVRLTSIKIQAKIILGLELRDDAPFVRRIWVSFQDVPRTSFSVEGITGVDVSSVPFMKRTLQQLVLRNIAPLCTPSYVTSRILSRKEWLEWQACQNSGPRGTLRAQRRATAAMARSEKGERSPSNEDEATTLLVDMKLESPDGLPSILTNDHDMQQQQDDIDS